jgi:hypothetical protein
MGRAGGLGENRLQHDLLAAGSSPGREPQNLAGYVYGADLRHGAGGGAKEPGSDARRLGVGGMSGNLEQRASVELSFVVGGDVPAFDGVSKSVHHMRQGALGSWS